MTPQPAGDSMKERAKAAVVGFAEAIVAITLYPVVAPVLARLHIFIPLDSWVTLCIVVTMIHFGTMYRNAATKDVAARARNTEA